ncbi:ATP-binding protein, partial [Salibaculum sp.]|uniref:ATP-binding protein n=1 Tax=Salibaculum sp. TaxID=2855480 RepID=UPI002B4599CB
MRLNRLDLTRYGKFTDLRLSFPPPAPGTPDLHVIYGANEAGKSTLLEGWLDFLFQIPVQSRMAFLHSYQTMQVGAALEIDGRTHDLVRVKKRDASLLDSSGAPMGEALLHGGLRGLDRSSYAAMFSLNRQTLDEGGESILASKGDLGELLFQASAGLTDLAAQLDDLRAESEAFLNKTGRKGALRDLGAAFDDLGKQIRDLDTA